MKNFELSFYCDDIYDELTKFIIDTYSYTYPIYGISRFCFSHGLHPKFHNISHALEKTVGIFKLNNKIVSCVINEGDDSGDVFFLFDSLARSKDIELCNKMINFAAGYGTVKLENNTRFLNIMVQKDNDILSGELLKKGFKKECYTQKVFLKEIKLDKVILPEGYYFIDGSKSSALDLAIVHMNSFNYSLKEFSKVDKAFANLRCERYYDKYLDLILMNKDNMPVGMACAWVSDGMPYAELEPLGVVFFERRKGLASALIQELSNRIIRKYKDCRYLTGGEQPFYDKLGFVCKNTVQAYRWEIEIFPSWDKNSEILNSKLNKMFFEK